MNPTFSPRTALALLVFGALAFLAMLWFIGQGDTGPGADNGQAHAAARGLTGYAALADMLEEQGHDVSRSRSPGHFDDEALLILTPSIWMDADEIAEIVEDRRYTGPTLIILPKWYAVRLPSSVKGAKKGWVRLLSAAVPGFAGDLGGDLAMTADVAKLVKGPADWQGLGLAGTLPDRSRVLGLEGGPWASLVRDSKGRDLVAYADDHGCYPVLDEAAGFGAPDEDDCEATKWNVMVAFEPDLFNNYGLADRDRAVLAARIVDLAREEQDLPIVFDLTLAGLSGERNLLTLAFAPPFLAATLCLILALAVVGWRAFGRFGPPVAEARTIGFGKAQLAANSGGFVRRSGRIHLLSAPYAAMIARRLARTLGLRTPDPHSIDAALARRAPGGPAFSSLADRLQAAQGSSETLRAAHALHELERTVRS